MSWTYDEIADEWLAGGAIAVGPQQVVAAFDRCERVFGREWINKSRGTSIGPLPTLHVVAMGTRLACLDGVVGAQGLIDKLVREEQSAAAELHAIHLLRSNCPTEVELFPKIHVRGRQREPDLRIRSEEDPWVYVEVAQPDASEDYGRVMTILNVLSGVIEQVTRSLDLEIFLRREPKDDELCVTVERILAFTSAVDAGEEELADGLGLLTLKTQPSGPITVDDHGEEVQPRLAMAKVKIETGLLTRRVVVRLPHSDDRAENFLRRESAQLPIGWPGLVMVDMAHAPGGFTSWVPLIQRRFQPSIHTRVGAVCLFSGGSILAEGGAVIVSQTKLLSNPHARTPLPAWISNGLINAGAGYRDRVAQNQLS
jgi:hypothetical protein